MGEYLSTPNKEKHSTDDMNTTVHIIVDNKYLVEVWSMWNARLEEINGRCSRY